MRSPRITLSDLLLYLILLFGPVAHGLVETWAMYQKISHPAKIILDSSKQKGNADFIKK